MICGLTAEQFGTLRLWIRDGRDCHPDPEVRNAFRWFSSLFGGLTPVEKKRRKKPRPRPLGPTTLHSMSPKSLPSRPRIHLSRAATRSHGFTDSARRRDPRQNDLERRYLRRLRRGERRGQPAATPELPGTGRAGASFQRRLLLRSGPSALARSLTVPH